MELGKLAEIVRGSSPRPKGDSRYYGPGVPRLMVSDVTRDGMYVTPKIDSLTLEGAKKSRPMKKGDFVIAVSGDPGEPCILAVDACIHDGFVGLRNLCKDRLNEQYLYQYFKYVKIKNQSQAVGAIYKNLNTDQVKKLKIPLPPLLIQRKIAEVLDAADHIRQRNKEVLAKYDQLAQSVFLEMFGDIIYKQELYKIEIGKACKFIDYRGKTPMRVEAGIPLISAKCVRAGWFDKSRIDFIEESTYDKVMVRGFPKSGDVLFTTEG
ncbi:MAG: restriction endonuclease subunit S, partial [Marinoscillum sp.]